jgi:hypothetical protein
VSANEIFNTFSTAQLMVVKGKVKTGKIKKVSNSLGKCARYTLYGKPNLEVMALSQPRRITALR